VIMTRRAVFMDRDGTVSDEVGYVNHIDRYRMLPKSASAIKRLNDAGFLTFIITNQSGVARGLFDEALVRRVHERLSGWVREAGAHLDGIYFCPHHPTEGKSPSGQPCDCRKPKPGLLQRAAREHDVDLAASYMIGDTVLDIEAGQRAGATSILVLTGYGKGDLEFRMKQRGLEPAYVAEDLTAAVEWILAREKKA